VPAFSSMSSAEGAIRCSAQASSPSGLHGFKPSSHTVKHSVPGGGRARPSASVAATSASERPARQHTLQAPSRASAGGRSCPLSRCVARPLRGECKGTTECKGATDAVRRGRAVALERAKARRPRSSCTETRGSARGDGAAWSARARGGRGTGVPLEAARGGTRAGTGREEKGRGETRGIGNKRATLFTHTSLQMDGVPECPTGRRTYSERRHVGLLRSECSTWPGALSATRTTRSLRLCRHADAAQGADFPEQSFSSWCHAARTGWGVVLMLTGGCQGRSQGLLAECQQRLVGIAKCGSCWTYVMMQSGVQGNVDGGGISV